MNIKIKNAIDTYKCRIPTDDELTALFDLINTSGLKLQDKEEACSYLQKVHDEAPANIKAKEERQARMNEERILQKRLAAERKEKISEWILKIGFGLGVALMILLPFTGMSFWIECLIVLSVMMGSLFFCIYYKNGHL